MAVLLTGATGYLGSYLAAEILKQDGQLNLIVRARGLRDAERRLWRSFQLHFDFAEFERRLSEQISLFPGDLTEPGLGLGQEPRRRLLSTTDSVIHCAASLNRRSLRTCLAVNFRGTLAMIRLAHEIANQGDLRRFTFVSTVAVAGDLAHEVVTEDRAVDWNRRDLDPYAMTKKMGEHLVRELLHDVPFTIVRPSTILGDSTRPVTTQFDMVRAFSVLAAAPVVPFRPVDRHDIVPVDWVTRALLKIHEQDDPAHDTFHLSAGPASPTYRQITETLAAAFGRPAPRFVPVLAGPVTAIARALSRVGPQAARRPAALLSVFLPYLARDTVFDNTRAVAVAGHPAPFLEWGVPALEWARRHDFRYPHVPWPGDPGSPPPTSPARTEGSLAS